MNKNLKSFSQNLKLLREEHNLTKKQVADAIGVSDIAIGRWETLQRIPSIETLVLLAKFFKVSADYLLGLEEF